jgi:N-acetylmuramoyl-L-alanine amidase
MTDPRDVFARTLWGEARGCGAAGMTHVASVILNRVARASWWGHDIISVCLKPWQFSCWNSADPNLPKLTSVTSTDPDFKLALSIASHAMSNQIIDATVGADSYHALSLKTLPSWTRPPSVKTFSDGWHAFYRTDVSPPHNVSIHAAPLSEADVLNQAELDALHKED